MASTHRNDSYDEPRLPRGTVVVGILVVVMIAGVYLIIQGLL